MSDVLADLQQYAGHYGYPEELPNFGPVARRAVSEITRLRAEVERLKAKPDTSGAVLVRPTSTIPCHRGGHHCRWPACPADCDGRPGAVPSGGGE